MAANPNATRHESKSPTLILQTFNDFRSATRDPRILPLDLTVGAEVMITTGLSYQPKILNLSASAGSAPVR